MLLISLGERVAMFEMQPVELREFSRLLQTACTQLTSGIPDTPAIAADEEGLTFSSPVWTSAMTRDVLNVTMRMSSVNVKAIAVDTISPNATSAAEVVERFFGPTLRVQIERWALARQQGLVRDGSPSNLPYDRMLIDRTLVSMLGDDMARLREAAMFLDRNREFQVGDELPSIPMGVNMGVMVFSRQIGMKLPVLGSWIPLCKSPLICFDGTYVALDGPIPEVMMAGAAGLRLGDLIETSMSSLDKRVIKCIHSIGEHPQGITIWDEALCYYVELEPDLTPLGSCRPTAERIPHCAAP